jgi:hypothetical protein
MPRNPIERDWYAMHLASKQLPQVAQAFEHFLRVRGQSFISQQLDAAPGIASLV